LEPPRLAVPLRRLRRRRLGRRRRLQPGQRLHPGGCARGWRRCASYCAYVPAVVFGAAAAVPRRVVAEALAQYVRLAERSRVVLWGCPTATS